MRKKRNKNRIWIAAMLTGTMFMWLTGSNTVYAASKSGTFIAGGETVNASLAGDANGATGSTSYTKGPGQVEVMVGGEAKVPGSSTQQTTGLVAMPDAVNTPGGVSATITPPAGMVLISAHSNHYATINGNSNSYSITLF